MLFQGRDTNGGFRPVHDTVEAVHGLVKALGICHIVDTDAIYSDCESFRLGKMTEFSPAKLVQGLGRRNAGEFLVCSTTIDAVVQIKEPSVVIEEQGEGSVIKDIINQQLICTEKIASALCTFQGDSPGYGDRRFPVDWSDDPGVNRNNP